MRRIAPVLAILTGSLFAAMPPTPVTRVDLHNGWQLQSACVLQGSTTGPAGLQHSNHPGLDGEILSSPLYRPIGWIPTTVPNTVVAAQVAAGTIKDPYSGMNLRNLPGMDYPLGSMFSNLAMLDTSPYKCGWWYRTSFRLPMGFAGKTVALHLDGVNYRADVWLNGKQVAGSTEIAGAWRVFDLNLAGLLAFGENVLAIEVFPPTENDLAISWVDWAPSPPDKNTGLFRDVYLTASGAVQLRFPFVATNLTDDFTSVQLTPVVEAWNATGHTVTADVTWEIDGRKVHQQAALEPEQKKTVSIDPAQFRELTIKDPKLWWPAELGTPTLYHARVSVTADGKPSDAQDVTFGIRQVTSELNNGHTLFKINGKPVLIRGGAWAPDLLLRSNPQRMEDQFRMTRDMGLNTIRLEGKLESQAFYDLADRYGIFIMAGWCCCDMWERWNEWGPEENRIAQASQRDQVRLLRNHPSMLVWLNGSDNPPLPAIESAYLRIEKEELWPNPTLSSASEAPTTVTGPSGVKMTGPYDYVPPDYWLDDPGKFGGAWGFNTETSPGPAILPPGSLRKFLPPGKLWPQNEVWGFHQGGERFQTLKYYNLSMEQRYGAPKDSSDFVRKAYAMDYEGERAMFEAYARNKFNSTGVIQWMLNNPWPSLIWHLYDYYLVPAGGYYGTKRATEPMHVMYSYNDRSVALVTDNSTANGVKVTASLYNVDGAQKWTQETTVDVTPDKATVAMTVPQPPELSTTYFLKLTATEASGRVASDNFYWLSTKPDELAWNETKDTAVTPQSAYSDMTALQNLPQVGVRLQMKPATSPCATPFAVHPAAAPTTPPVTATECDGGFLDQQLTVSNPGKAVAFMTHLRLAKSDGEDVVPAFFEDNFVSLLPGESRTIGVRYRTADLGKTPAHYEVSGWNVQTENIPVR